MKYKPHNYQQFAIDFILKNPVAAIFLDMGMGKTSLTLMAILHLLYDSFEVKKVLIIAPLRVAKHTWSDEIAKWDEFGILRYSIVVGTAAERLAALRKDADIYIINRENVPWLVEKSGMPFDFDMIVIDELSSFKNSQAKRFKSLMRVRPKASRVVGLTGTPTGSGGYMDLFAEFNSMQAKLLKYRIPSDRCIADINERVRKVKNNGFSTPINRDDEPVQTIVSGSSLYRMCDGLLMTDRDIIGCQTFPQDYDFMDQSVQYICGMSVPPVMMAKISEQVYRQWLKGSDADEDAEA